jgi:hypothetical protein
MMASARGIGAWFLGISKFLCGRNQVLREITGAVCVGQQLRGGFRKPAYAVVYRAEVRQRHG